MVGVCDLDLFTYRASCTDLGAVFGDDLRGVCFTCGERANDIGVSFSQANIKISDGDHQGVYRESLLCLCRDTLACSRMRFESSCRLNSTRLWISMQLNSRRRDIKVETLTKEERPFLVQS